MRKILKLIALVTFITTASNAYNIGGAYANLVSCNYGMYGYQSGYIGTYSVNGALYTVFFGSRFCEY